MRISIDKSVAAGEALPFLLVGRVSAGQADTAAIAGALRSACAEAAAGPVPEVEAAIERYRAQLVALGRNPNRYRISSDALLRRCRREGAVPSILPLVDLNNILSLRTGWPVGCYAAPEIRGDVTLRLGAAGETMATLGKGDFDIANLPVLCDEAGPFGSTISDSVGTAVAATTTDALFVLYGYGSIDEVRLTELLCATCSGGGVAVTEPPHIVRP